MKLDLAYGVRWDAFGIVCCKYAIYGSWRSSFLEKCPGLIWVMSCGHCVCDHVCFALRHLIEIFALSERVNDFEITLYFWAGDLGFEQMSEML